MQGLTGVAAVRSSSWAPMPGGGSRGQRGIQVGAVSAGEVHQLIDSTHNQRAPSFDWAGAVGRSAQTSTEPTCPACTPITLERSHCGGMSSKIFINFVTFVNQVEKKRIRSKPMQVGFPLPHTAPHAVAGPPDGWPRRIAISVMAPRSITVSWLGQVASLGERRLTDRFGLEGRRAWRLCTGTDDEAIYPMAFVETVVERMSLSFPTSLVHALSLAVDTLLRRAYARPEMRGRYAGRASLRCAATGWPSWERSISFREPPTGGRAHRMPSGAGWSRPRRTLPWRR